MSQDQKAADKQFKKAQQAITTGIFNWSKDYASAASMFQQALKLYKKIPNHQKCLKTLDKLIQCNTNINKAADPWAIARNYEQIIQIKMRHYPNTSPKQFIEIGNKAFMNFRMSQSTDKGVGVVAKIAKYLIDNGHKKQGVQYLQTAYQTIISQEKVFKKQDIFNQLIDIYIENKAYEGAEKLYIEEIKRNQGKDCDQMGLIVLALILIQRQPKRAQKKMYQLAQIIPSFLTTNQCQAAEQLINAYNKGQDEKFRKLTTKATITCIYPVSIVRKLRDTNVPKMQQAAGNNNQGNNQVNNQIKDLLF